MGISLSSSPKNPACHFLKNNHIIQIYGFYLFETRNIVIDFISTFILSRQFRIMLNTSDFVLHSKLHHSKLQNLVETFSLKNIIFLELKMGNKRLGLGQSLSLDRELSSSEAEASQGNETLTVTENPSNFENGISGRTRTAVLSDASPNEIEMQPWTHRMTKKTNRKMSELRKEMNGKTRKRMREVKNQKEHNKTLLTNITSKLLHE